MAKSRRVACNFWKSRIGYKQIQLPGWFRAAYLRMTAGDRCPVPFVEARRMSELNSREMEPVTGGHKSMREIPNELIKLYCQKLKSQGVGMEEAVIAVMKY